jgi:hypothetical protein
LPLSEIKENLVASGYFAVRSADRKVQIPYQVRHISFYSDGSGYIEVICSK